MSNDVVTETQANPDIPTTEPTIWNKIGFWFPHIIILGYAGVIASAFTIQFTQSELPCPLCMLQRMGMVLVGVAALWMIGLALKGRLDYAGYMRATGMMIIAAMLGGATALRQVELHILPGDEGYGDPVLGLHLYTWSLITFIVVVLYSAIVLMFGKTFYPTLPKGEATRWVSRIIVGIFIFIIVANIIMVFSLEGFNWTLPDDPTQYELFHQFGG